MAYGYLRPKAFDILSKLRPMCSAMILRAVFSLVRGGEW